MSSVASSSDDWMQYTVRVRVCVIFFLLCYCSLCSFVSLFCSFSKEKTYFIIAKDPYCLHKM